FERRSRREYLRSARPLLDSPNRALLIHYVTRTVRAVSAVSVQALGRHAHVLTPASWNRVASIALAIPPPLKHGGAMYDALFERRSRREYLRSARPLLDSPNRALLIHYVTRTVRAVSAVSVQALGRHAHVLTPASWNRVASIALAIPPPLKHGGAMYDALFER